MMNSRVSLQQPSALQDATGQPVTSWSEVAKVWANLRHKTGAEVLRAEKDVSIVQTSMKVRSRRNITAGMRAVHGSTVYDIKAVLPDEAGRQYMFLICEVISG